jgi:hypothetical protein
MLVLSKLLCIYFLIHNKNIIIIDILYCHIDILYGEHIYRTLI